MSFSCTVKEGDNVGEFMQEELSLNGEAPARISGMG